MLYKAKFLCKVTNFDQILQNFLVGSLCALRTGRGRLPGWRGRVHRRPEPQRLGSCVPRRSGHSNPHPHQVGRGPADRGGRAGPARAAHLDRRHERRLAQAGAVLSAGWPGKLLLKIFGFLGKKGAISQKYG